MSLGLVVGTSLDHLMSKDFDNIAITITTIFRAVSRPLFLL